MEKSKIAPFDIVPHVGIGPVKLGMTVAEVEAALKPYPAAWKGRSSNGSLEYFFDAALQVEISEESKTASFIGLSHHDAILAHFDSQDVFDLPAKELFQFIASRDQSKKHVFDSSGYRFDELIVTLYEADEQYDYKGDKSRPVYGQVGVGGKEYLDAVQAIEARRKSRDKHRG